MIEKALPQDLQAEAAVLGALLLDRDTIVKVAPFLRPGDFYEPKHRMIYAAILSLYNRRVPPDAVTLAAELQSMGKLDEVGGPAILARLPIEVPTAVHVEYYAGIVVQKAIDRRMISAGSNILLLGYDEHIPQEERIAKAQNMLFEAVRQDGKGAAYTDMRGAIGEFYDRLDVLEATGGASGVPSGYPDLDRMTGGFQPSDLVIIAARPGTGKTSLVLNIAANAAEPGQGEEGAYPVGIFSLEMSREQLVNRMIAVDAEVDSQKLRLGHSLSEADWLRVSASAARLSELPIYIDDTASISIADLRSKAYRMKAEHDIRLLIVDYLQLVQGGMSTRGRDANRTQEVDEVARNLKMIARELGVPVLACAQLSRAVENRASHIPMLSDLRESGGIENHADIVSFIYREEMYDKYSSRRGIADVIFAKHRNGPLGTVSLQFEDAYTRFRPLSFKPEPLVREDYAA